MITINKIKKGFVFIRKIAMVLLIAFTVCNILLYRFIVDIGKINEIDFMFNFVGILLGFALTIFSFIISMMDKIKEKYEKQEPKPNKEDVDRFNRKITILYQEMRENILFIFISLVIISCMYIVENMEIKPFHLYKEFMFSKSVFLQSLKLSIFSLNMYAIYDLIIISFRISENTGVSKVSTKDHPPTISQ